MEIKIRSGRKIEKYLIVGYDGFLYTSHLNRNGIMCNYAPCSRLYISYLVPKSTSCVIGYVTQSGVHGLISGCIVESYADINGGIELKIRIPSVIPSNDANGFEVISGVVKIAEMRESECHSIRYSINESYRKAFDEKMAASEKENELTRKRIAVAKRAAIKDRPAYIKSLATTIRNVFLVKENKTFRSAIHSFYRNNGSGNSEGRMIDEMKKHGFLEFETYFFITNMSEFLEHLND